MKKVVRLTESDLVHVIKQVIKEQTNSQVVGAAAAGAAVGGVPGAIAGAAIAIAQGGGTGKNVLKLISYCGSKGMGKPSITVQQAAGYADKLNSAVEGLGTNEALIGQTLRSIKYFPDFCAVTRTYQQRHGESLANALDGDIDLPGDWKKYVWLPLLDMLNRSKSAGQSLGKAGGMGDQLAGAQGLAVNAQKCGWGKDVNGYKASGYKCPKPKTAAKPVGQGSQNKPVGTTKTRSTNRSFAKKPTAQQPTTNTTPNPNIQKMPMQSAKDILDKSMQQLQQQPLRQAQPMPATAPQQPTATQQPTAPETQQPQRNRPLRNLFKRNR